MLTSGCSPPDTARRWPRTPAYTRRPGIYKYVTLYIYIHIYTHTYIHTYIHKYVYLCLPVAVDRQILLEDRSKRRFILGHEVYINMLLYIYIYTYIHIHIYIHICINIYIYAYQWL